MSSFGTAAESMEGHNVEEEPRNRQGRALNNPMSAVDTLIGQFSGKKTLRLGDISIITPLIATL